MASTYTTNLGIEKIQTGQQAGQWGDTTNTNFDIIDQAVNGIVTVTLTSAGTSGSPNDIAITDGAESDGRNKFIRLYSASDLGGTVYVRITPSDAEKIVHIRNDLNTQNAVVFQGNYDAGRSIGVTNGRDVLLKFDGGGDGSATVEDVNNDLGVTKITAATVDINGGTIDGTTIGGTTPANATFGTANATLSTINTLITTSLTASATTITGGTGSTINNVAIGNSTPAAGTFSSLTSNGIDDNATAIAMTIDSSQQVGIGTAVPSAELHIKETSAGLSSSPKVLIEGTGGSLTNTAELELTASGVSASLAMVNSPTNDSVTLAQGNSGIAIDDLSNGISMYTAGTAGSPDFRISTSGNVGVGTVSPSNLLSVVDTGTTGPAFSVESTNGSATAPRIELKGQGDATIKMVSGGLGGLQIINEATGTIELKNNGTLVMTNDDDGTENTMTLKDNTLNIANIPTSSSGLSSGDIWNDSGTLKIVS